MLFFRQQLHQLTHPSYNTVCSIPLQVPSGVAFLCAPCYTFEQQACFGKHVKPRRCQVTLTCCLC